jgi:heat shock protein HslJ
MKHLWLLIPACLVVASCERNEIIHPDADTIVENLFGVTWQLIALEGHSGSAPVPASVPITVIFTDSTAGGRLNCNSYGASGRVSLDGIISMSTVFMTRAYCPVPPYDTEFLRALQRSRVIELDANTLRLRYQSDTHGILLLQQLPPDN